MCEDVYLELGDIVKSYFFQFLAQYLKRHDKPTEIAVRSIRCSDAVPSSHNRMLHTNKVRKRTISRTTSYSVRTT